MNPTSPGPPAEVGASLAGLDLPDLGRSPAAAKCRRAALVCSVTAIGLAVLTLIGWQTGWLYLAQLIPNSNQMVRHTAANFVLLGGALYVLVRWGAWSWPRYFTAGVALLSTLWGVLEILEFFGVPRGLHLLDRLQLRESVRSSGMSPLTALNLVLIGVALLTLAARPRRFGRQVAVGCATAVAFMTALVALGYAHNISLFQSQIGIAMAFPTAMAFAAVGIGVIAAAGPDHFLLRPLTGTSARALLLRAFVPVTLAAVLLSDVLRANLLRHVDREQEVVVLGLTAILVAVLVSALVSKVAQVVGRQLDRAEEDRARALEEMRQARDAAQEANRAKDQFLANMSHELRTPLNAIIGYSEMLQEEAEERGLPDLLPDLRRIHDSGKHLLALINDILDLAKIKAGRVELLPETFSVPERLREVVHNIRLVVERNGNQLELDCPDDVGTMYADLTRLRQCLFNLLSNAGKFTDHGRVTLTVRRRRIDGRDWIFFEVRDTGIGMTPDQLRRIFRPFVQADSTTSRKYGGTGLGLALSLSICRLMGGDILVESEPGRGSAFTLKLPAEYVRFASGEGPVIPKSVPPTILPPTREPPPPTHGPTVLVVDDDPAVQDMLSRLLTREGYEVVGVTRGEDVVIRARELRPSAITLDVMMPGMDGWSVLSALKADPELADIPVIMLTIVDDKNLGYAMGAVDYLVKPVDHSRFLNILRSHCPAPVCRLALVVEDDDATREMFRRTLQGDGWTVTEACNGRQALECVARQPPGLILLDLMMPEMDGFEFLEELRQHPEWSSIPVVVVTAKDLTPQDRTFLTGAMFLGGCVKRIIQKGSYSREELLQEARSLIAAQSSRHSPP